MAKKRATKKKSWTVQEIAEAFGLTPHHTRRLVHKHVAEPIKDGGTMVVPAAQFAKLKAAYLETIEPPHKEEAARIARIKKL